MKHHLKRFLALAGVAVLAVSALQAQDSRSLVDALVKKGVLTDQEGEEIRADLVKEYNSTSAGKLNVGSYVKQLKLYGDARWRYEYAAQDGQTDGVNNAHNWRARYRIRLGAEYKLADNFSSGFELDSATSNDTGNQTIGAGFGKFSINVGLLYLNYKPWEWVTLTGGKFKNPFYTTDLLWSPDLNPEGAVQLFSWQVSDQLTVGLTTGELNYVENSDSGSSSGVKLQDSWIYAAQLPITYKYSRDGSVTFAPAFYTYTGNYIPSSTASNAFLTGSPNTTNNLNGASNLNLITAPGDVSFKLFKQKAKFYWDFVYNASGESRVHQTYNIVTQNNDLSDSVAWLAGFQIGDSKKKGDWLVGIDYRQIGLGSIDPNISDPSWGSGYLNQQGIKLRTSYNFTDFVQGGITYYNTWNYKENIANSGTNSQTGVNGVNSTSTLQLDLLWKF
jgi:hypothetical protein